MRLSERIALAFPAHPPKARAAPAAAPRLELGQCQHGRHIGRQCRRAAVATVFADWWTFDYCREHALALTKHAPEEWTFVGPQEIVDARRAACNDNGAYGEVSKHTTEPRRRVQGALNWGKQ